MELLMFIKTLIRQLPEPYRKQALDIIKEKGIAYEHPDKLPINQCNTQSEAVAQAFSWFDSPQGDEYWREFYFSLKEKEANDAKRVL